MNALSRRHVLKTGAAFAGATLFRGAARAAQSPFKVAVISDEISQDFEHACHVIAQEFNLHWVELREVWGKNLQQSTDPELAEAQRILAKYGLHVTDIASPLFKVNWPGAPPSSYGSAGDLHGATDTEYKKQDEVFERSVALAKRFGTNKVRCFDFWRLDDQKPYRAAINEKLDETAERAGRQGILLVLENEFACNTATGREAAETLHGVPSKSLALNWDPGNAVMRGELDAFPNGWNALPKNRIHHCHVKNAIKDSAGKVVWAPVDKGYVDWAAQFRELKAAGYSDAVSLETHWRGAGSPEASTRVSWQGMRQRLLEAGCL